MVDLIKMLNRGCAKFSQSSKIVLLRYSQRKEKFLLFSNFEKHSTSYTSGTIHRPSRHGQTTDPVQLKLCSSHKRRLASNADVGFYCVNIMTTSFSSPERIVWTIMSGIITVTRLMSSLGIKDQWVKWIYLWFIHTLYAKRTRWNYMYIYFIAKKRKFLKVDCGIYFKSCVLKLTDITKQN